MRKVILLGEKTDLLTNIRNEIKPQIANFKEYRFSNNNLIYQLEQKIDFEYVSIIADLSINLHENLWALFLTLDFLKNKNIKIEKLIFPYFPYSRSNHKHTNYTSGLFTIINYLNKYKIDKIITFDPHFENQKLPFQNEFKMIAQEYIFGEILNINLTNHSLIIGTDKGCKKRIDSIKNKFDLDGFTFNKIRKNHNEKVQINITETQMKKIKTTDHISIFDDEICSGDTMQKTITKIIEIKENIVIDVYITHNFMKKTNNAIFGNINYLYTTNSISNELQIDKIKTIDLSEMIAGEING